MHSDRLVDLSFPMKIRDELVNSRRESLHHVLPQSGRVSYWINRGEEDIPEVIELFKMRYEQLKPRSKPKQEESSSGSNLAATMITTIKAALSTISQQDK
jgi:hypothetical protein